MLEDERALVDGKRGATRLSFALLLKFYTRHGRFPAGGSELPGAVVEFVARQVGVASAELGSYQWAGRSIERHRAEIREHLGFRECSVGDAEQLGAASPEPRSATSSAATRRRARSTAPSSCSKTPAGYSGARSPTAAVAPPTPGSRHTLTGKRPDHTPSAKVVSVVHAYRVAPAHITSSLGAMTPTCETARPEDFLTAT